MDNITHLSFSPKLKSTFLPPSDLCEYFKVDFRKKKIRAYKMLVNRREPKPYHINTTVTATTLNAIVEDTLGQPN